MKVSYFPKQLTKEKTTLILGGFESFHNGHMKLLKKAQKLKKPIAIMLVANPQNLPNYEGGVYQTLDVRLQQLANLNIKYASVVKINEQLISLEGKVFLNKIIKSVNAQTIIFGQDFTVGKNKGYDAKRIIQEYPSSLVVSKLKINNKKISTTLLKELLVTGDVELISQLCPFPYTVNIKVNSNKIVTWQGNMLLHAGIYAIYVIQNEVQYYGLLHVSMNKKVVIDVPDIQIKNNSYEPKIMLIKKVRTIIKGSMDKIFNQDEELVLKSLNNVL